MVVSTSPVLGVKLLIAAGLFARISLTMSHPLSIAIGVGIISTFMLLEKVIPKVLWLKNRGAFLVFLGNVDG
jgi:hypothetical protein